LAPKVPAVVLDCFAGSGTTGQVALHLHRRAILCELQRRYIALIKERCARVPKINLPQGGAVMASSQCL
jgi:DNA modification methylase